MIKEDLQLPDGPLGRMYGQAMAIIQKDEICEVGPEWYRVWSQTYDDVWYDVRLGKKGWTCKCEYGRGGHNVCRHVLAAFIMAASEDRERIGDMDRSDLNLPERWCRECGSTYCRWREARPLKRMGPAGGEVHRYECLKCGSRFADRAGFEGVHFAEWVVMRALRLVARKQTPKDAAATLGEDDSVRVSGRTIQRWVTKFPGIIEAFTGRLKIKCGDAVSVDEKHFKSRGKSRWQFRTMCMDTRFIISTDTAADKLNYYAGGLFADMAARLGRRPRILIGDCLRGFFEGFRDVLATSPEPESLHIANAALKGKHVDNNRHERQNGDQADRIKAGTRGFNSDCPGVLTLHVVYHNFLRPHLGIGGMTPAEKAGIHIPGPDRLLTLIRCAAAARLAFA